MSPRDLAAAAPVEPIRSARGLTLINSPAGTAFHDPSTGRWISLPEGSQQLKPLLELLASTQAPVPRARVEQRLAERSGAHVEAVRRSLDALLELGVLEAAPDAERAGGESWHEGGWSEALWFHAHTAAIERLDYATVDGQRQDIALMRRYRADGSMPAGDDRLDRQPPPPPLAGGERIAGGRGVGMLCETSPAPPPAARLARDQLEWLLAMALGWTGELALPISGRHPLRTSPSGGARHPTDGYVVVTDVEDVEAGVHACAGGRLAPLASAPADAAALLRDAVVRQPYWLSFEAAAAIVFATTFDRSMARYRESHSYRVLHHDAGHLMETTALLAASIGRPTLRLYSLDEAALEAALGLERLETSVLSAVVIG